MSYYKKYLKYKNKYLNLKNSVGGGQSQLKDIISYDEYKKLSDVEQQLYTVYESTIITDKQDESNFSYPNPISFVRKDKEKEILRAKQEEKLKRAEDELKKIEAEKEQRAEKDKERLKKYLETQKVLEIHNILKKDVINDVEYGKLNDTDKNIYTFFYGTNPRMYIIKKGEETQNLILNLFFERSVILKKSEITYEEYNKLNKEQRQLFVKDKNTYKKIRKFLGFKFTL